MYEALIISDNGRRVDRQSPSLRAVEQSDRAFELALAQQRDWDAVIIGDSAVIARLEGRARKSIAGNSPLRQAGLRLFVLAWNTGLRGLLAELGFEANKMAGFQVEDPLVFVFKDASLIKAVTARGLGPPEVARRPLQREDGPDLVAVWVDPGWAYPGRTRPGGPEPR
jgi:hypothetical protein